MEIGIPRESKESELRVSLVPRDVKKLVESDHSVFVESNAGISAGFSNEDYLKAGAKIEDSVWNHELIVKVKAQAGDPVEKGQILMAYLHVEKDQSPLLLRKLLEKSALSYAFEEIRDRNGKRLVTLGFEGGVVGMYEGLRVFGAVLEEAGEKNLFKSLPEIKKTGKEKAYFALSKLCLKRKINIAIMGDGNVSRGAQEVLGKAGIVPQILREDKTLHMERFLPALDILVNAVTWEPGQPHLVAREMLKLMKKTALIVDISCDEKGAVETCTPTIWGNPTYKKEGITHFCIDNLPAAIPRESSIHLSSMILQFVLSVADGIELKSGIMTKNRVFEFKARKKKETCNYISLKILTEKSVKPSER